MKLSVALLLVCFMMGCSRQPAPIQVAKPSPADGMTAKADAQSSNRLQWMQYSTMHIVEEEGDFVGTDLRLAKTGSGYKMILFCGEGVPEGPVRATFEVHDNRGVIHPTNTVCGETMEIEIEPNGVRLKVEVADWEFIPKHRNFIREERWR